MHDFCFTIPYGLLVVAGGVAGYVRKGSTMSLVGGVSTGLLLLLAGYMNLTAFNNRTNSYFAFFLELVCSSALAWVMGQRYLATSKVMPAGVVAVISGIMTVFYLYKISTGGNHIPPKAD